MSIDPFLYFNHILNIKRKSDFDMFSLLFREISHKIMKQTLELTIEWTTSDEKSFLPHF